MGGMIQGLVQDHSNIGHEVIFINSKRREDNGVKCYNCNRFGHFARDCRSRRRSRSNQYSLNYKPNSFLEEVEGILGEIEVGQEVEAMIKQGREV